MNELQKKVLLFLLQELKEHIRDMSCAEAEIPALTEDDRRILTQMLWSHWNMEDEYEQGHANKEFGIGSLVSLTQYWLTGEKP